jgi:hypothetical protein
VSPVSSPENGATSWGADYDVSRDTLKYVLKHRLLVVLLAVGLFAAACGGDSITATNCDELTDETIGMFQRLIDDIDSEFGDMTMEELDASGEELPSVEEFEEDAATIDQLATELDCSSEEMSAAVQDRLGELSAQSDLGRFLIDAMRAGGL